MFVYLLQHATESRFKIGKANDIYQRIPSIGGFDAFDLTSSLCIQLPTEKDAYKLEKSLHRLFGAFNLPVDKSNRYSGDTEQFNTECFERVLKFLKDNCDLICGASPMPIPSPPIIVRQLVARISPEERAAQKEANRLNQIKSIEKKHGITLKWLETFAGYMESGIIVSGIWQNKTEFNNPLIFLCVPDNNQECIDFLQSSITNTRISCPPPNSGGTSIFNSYIGYQQEDRGFIMIQNYYGSYVDKWYSDISIKETSQLLIHYIKKRLSIIPGIYDFDVFGLLQLSRYVDSVDKMGVEGIKEKIRCVMLHKYSNDRPFKWSQGASCLEDWILSYCIWGLSELDITQDDIKLSLDNIRDLAKRDLKRWKREVDPVWGYYNYIKPLPTY